MLEAFTEKNKGVFSSGADHYTHRVGKKKAKDKTALKKLCQSEFWFAVFM